MVRTFAPGRVVAFDLKRTLQTAAALGCTPPVHAPRSASRQRGSVSEGIDALRQRDPDAYAAWRGGLLTPEGAESFDTLKSRVVAATKELLGVNKTVLVVTHGGPIRTVCAHWLCLPPKRIVPVSPGSVTVLTLPAAPDDRAASEPGGAKLHTFNWRPHGALLDAPD